MEKSIYNFFQNSSLLFSRITIAIIFLFAGIAKWPFWQENSAEIPQFMEYLVKLLSIVEPLGAIALAIGFLSRWAAAGLAIIMIGAIIILIATLDVKFFTQLQFVGWDYNLLLLSGSLFIVAFGGGKFSLDHFFQKKRVE